MVESFMRGSGLVHDAAVQGEQPGTAAEVRRMQLCCWVGLDYPYCILYVFVDGGVLACACGVRCTRQLGTRCYLTLQAWWA